MLPEVRFGNNASLPDWRAEKEVPDADDDEIATPYDVVEMLGFDPAE